MSLPLLSQDILLLIMEATDPESLLQFCRASRGIYYLVMETHALRFKVELALNGMKDGPPSQAYPAHMRLEQLLDFKKSWPALHWSHEDILEIPCPIIKGVSGGIFYHASENSTHTTYQWTLELYELRSFRIGRPRNDHHLRYLKFNVPFDIKALVIDPTQNLLVLVEMDEPMHATNICVRVHFRDLWTGGFHPNASADFYIHHTDCWGPLHAGLRMWVQQVEVCGDRIAVTVRSDSDQSGGTTELVIIDWPRNRAKRWRASLMSFQFLSDSRVLVAAQFDETARDRRPLTAPRQNANGAQKGALTASLLLGDISNFADASVPWIRIYRLPDSWKFISSIQFDTNMSPSSGCKAPNGAFFYSDPNSRITVLSVKFDPNATIGMKRSSTHTMLVIEESLFRPPAYGEPTILAWGQWGQMCLLRDIPNHAYSFKAIGRRLLQLETGDGPISSRRCLRLTEFNPRAASYTRGEKNNKCEARGTSFHPQGKELLNYTRSQSMYLDGTIDLDATEDNLVFYEEDEETTRVRILTFGKKRDGVCLPSWKNVCSK